MRKFQRQYDRHPDRYSGHRRCGRRFLTQKPFHVTPVGSEVAASDQAGEASASASGGHSALSSRTILACAPGEYHYEYNAKSQARHAYGCLQYVPKEDRHRNNKNQLNAGGEQRRDDDDGGHLIGSLFGGSCGPENLFPQNLQLNRGGYRSLELQWKKQLDAGCSVYVDIYASAAGNNQRQDSICGSFIVISPDGSSYEDSFSFTNESKATLKEWEEIVEMETIEADPEFSEGKLDPSYSALIEQEPEISHYKKRICRR